MSELGNPFEGTAPPLPLQNGPEPAPKKRGRPKGWKKPVTKVAKAKPATAARGKRGSRLARKPSKRMEHQDATAAYVPPAPSFAGSDNIAGLLAGLDSQDVQLFFDMYRAILPRDPEDRRTIVAALQASFV